MDSIITLHNVYKVYRLGQTNVEALCGVNLELKRGKFYSIIGPSGSGKSSLLHIIGCMDTPTRGDVWVNGQHLNGLNDRMLTRLRGRQVGFIFQAFHLNPILTVRENVGLALRFLGVNKREALKQAEVWLGKLGLSHRLRHYPSELSGGERQRVAIARAIVKKPVLILADEPTGNLDRSHGREVVALLKQINREEGTTIIQVTHNPEIAALSDEIITLCDGQVVAGQI